MITSGVSLRLSAPGRAVVLRSKPPAASRPFGLPSLTSSRRPALRASLAYGPGGPVGAAPGRGWGRSPRGCRVGSSLRAGRCAVFREFRRQNRRLYHCASSCKRFASPGTHPVLPLRSRLRLPCPPLSGRRYLIQIGTATELTKDGGKDRRASVDPKRHIYAPAQESSNPVS